MFKLLTTQQSKIVYKNYLFIKLYLFNILQMYFKYLWYNKSLKKNIKLKNKQ